MILHNQICSLELSRKLCELGVKQDSLFYWGSYENPLIGIVSEETCPSDRWFIFDSVDRVYKNCPPDWIYSAFTVAELGEMLPGSLRDKRYRLEFIKGNEGRYVYAYTESNDLPPLLMFSSNSEANARAVMLIHLIENNLIDV